MKFKTIFLNFVFVYIKFYFNSLRLWLVVGYLDMAARCSPDYF